MNVLIITRSDDNACIETVSSELHHRGANTIRLNTDRYPDLVQLSCEYDHKGNRRILKTDKGQYHLDEITAVWYRRFNAGASLPVQLGDTHAASLQETRRTLFGAIAALPCFHLDPLESVRRTDHKELQLDYALKLGLDIPKTLVSNDPVEVLEFFESVNGKMVTKMQHSFAIYREGIENVVFTNVINRKDLDDLSGLRFCPMTFQEHIEKKLELRVTVVGQKVMTAAIDSQRQDNTAVDWRRDGVGLIDCWTNYQLPVEVEQKLLRLTAKLGLNYAACDFIVTPEDRLVFLEVNAVGEFFWLEKSPGLTISAAIAGVLLGVEQRQNIDFTAWENHI